MNNRVHICTTIEQSKRLLSLWVDPYTADFRYEHGLDGKYYAYAIQPYNNLLKKDDVIPAWSLSKLLDMIPESVEDPNGGNPFHPELIKKKDGYVLSIRRREHDCLVGTYIEQDPIECCVCIIEWLIKNGELKKKK